MSSNPTHGRFSDILDGAEPALRVTCEFLRGVIARQHKAFVEVVWPRQKIASFGVGPKKMTQHYAYIAVLGDHVNLGFYHGAALNDPTGLLEGTGKKLRHVKIRSLADSKNPAVAGLLRRAIADRKTHASNH